MNDRLNSVDNDYIKTTFTEGPEGNLHLRHTSCTVCDLP